MKLKKVLALFTGCTILFVSMSLAGCSKGNTSASGSNPGSSAAGTNASANAGTAVDSGQKSIVNFWYYFSNAPGTAIAKNITNFNSSQNKIEVKGQYIPFAEIKKQISVSAAGGQLPDMVQMDNPDHASFAAMGILEDITDRVKAWGQADKFFSGPINSAIYNGKYYGLPIDSNCLALYYNEDLFKAAGISAPPQTWDELKQYAEKLTKDQVKGFAFSAIKSEEGTFQFLPWLWSTGADYDKLNTPEAVEALELLADMYKKGYVSKDILTQRQSDVSAAQFATGKAAMMVNGPWIIPTLKKDAPNLNWKVAVIPTKKNSSSVLGGENLAIIKGKNVDGAWEFVKYMESPEVVEQWYKDSGYLPSRKDIIEKSDYWKNDPILSVFAKQMETARARGPHPKWPQISEPIQVAIQEALTGVKSPQDALKDAAAKIEKVK